LRADTLGPVGGSRIEECLLAVGLNRLQGPVNRIRRLQERDIDKATPLARATLDVNLKRSVQDIKQVTKR